jgi:hypothetical protein
VVGEIVVRDQRLERPRTDPQRVTILVIGARTRVHPIGDGLGARVVVGARVADVATRPIARRQMGNARKIRGEMGHERSLGASARVPAEGDRAIAAAAGEMAAPTQRGRGVKEARIPVRLKTHSR